MIHNCNVLIEAEDDAMNETEEWVEMEFDLDNAGLRMKHEQGTQVLFCGGYSFVIDTPFPKFKKIMKDYKKTGFNLNAN